MRSLLAGLVLLTSTPAVTLAATIPLREGDYSRGACSAGHSDISDSISVFPRVDPKIPGSEPFISPSAEGKNSNCMLKRVKASGDRYSGKATCDSGMKARLADGSYKFDWQVIDRQTFVSRGVTYRWCAAHR